MATHGRRRPRRIIPEVDEISLVDKAANGEDMLLIKRRAGGSGPPAAAAGGGADVSAAERVLLGRGRAEADPDGGQTPVAALDAAVMARIFGVVGDPRA